MNRSVPYIIWTKDKEFNKTIDMVGGMVDSMPTLSNMFGLKPKYALGNDLMSIDTNIVSFPNGNWLTNDIYYNSNKDEYKVINPDAIIDKDTITRNNDITNKKLQVSNEIIIYDLIKNEKDRLQRSEGE